MLQPNEIYLNGNNSTVQIASAHETSKTFSYNGNEVLFDIKDDVMVNATQLAKIYGKRPNDYLSLPATNQLINAITRKYGISENQLVISKAGSSHNGGGTWMHRLIVVDFCQWLDIDLKLWCTEKLDELMRYGMTATQPTLEQMINNPDLVISLATQLKSEREEKQRLALEVQKKEQEKQTIIEEAKPAVVFTECVTSSSTNILIGDLAKLITQNGYKIGEIRLYEWMVENKSLIRRQRYSRSKNKYINDYMPTQRAAEMGLFFVKERPIVSGENPIFIKHTCYVTGKGQVYFLNKFKSLGCMIMEIKMNNSLTFDEVADKLGCSVEDLQKIALENGLIDENGNPTEMAIREGLFSQYATMEDEYGTVNITVSHSEYDMIAVCISDPEDHERDSVAFISREKAHALGEYLLNM